MDFAIALAHYAMHGIKAQVHVQPVSVDIPFLDMVVLKATIMTMITTVDLLSSQIFIKIK
jgi:N-glycosylase/DNA lyase